MKKFFKRFGNIFNLGNSPWADIGQFWADMGECGNSWVGVGGDENTWNVMEILGILRKCVEVCGWGVTSFWGWGKMCRKFLLSYLQPQGDGYAYMGGPTG